MKDHGGYIWWCTGKGPFRMDPSQFLIDNTRPRVSLQTIEIQNQEIDYRQLQLDSAYATSIPNSDRILASYQNVSPTQNFPHNLALPYDLNNLKFFVTGIHWNSISDLDYEHWLEGFDEGWSRPRNEGEVVYTNLSPGDYVLKLRATSKYGVLSEIYEYPFTILAPWWARWWAILLEVVLALAVLVGFIRYRTYRLEKNRRLLQRMVQKRTLELEKSKEDLESSLQETLKAQNQLILSEKMASIGLLSSGIAHELNNPIHAILNGSKILEKDLHDLRVFLENLDKSIVTDASAFAELKAAFRVDELLRSLEINKDILSLGAEKTSQIVRSLRNYSRLDDEKMVEGDIHQALDSTLTLLESKIKHVVNVERKYGTIPTVLCYYGQLGQVFMNLIGNAVDAILEDENPRKDEGKIIINTLKEGDYIIIRIDDNGVGIPEDKQNRVFEPFYTSKEVGKGTGIGLSICKDIVEKHNGELLLKSKYLEGTSFEVRLPLRPKE
jgi:signal transduction histidine kinase